MPINRAPQIDRLASARERLSPIITNRGELNAHRQALLDCHAANASLRSVAERIGRNTLDKDAIEHDFREALKDARAASREIETRLTQLKKQLDASINLRPKEMRQLLRDMDRRSTELDTVASRVIIYPCVAGHYCGQGM